jgi:hypothetical protein
MDLAGRGQQTFFVVVCMLIIAAPVSAMESLRPPIHQIAEAVSKIVKARGGDSISVGQFTGPPTFASSAGPGIQIMLQEEFKQLGVAVKRFGAPIGLRGQYLYTQPEGASDDAQQQIRLQVVLTDASGQALTTLNQEVPLDTQPGFPVPDGEGPTMDVEDGTIDVDTFTGGAEAAALLGVTWDFERGGLSMNDDPDIVQMAFAQPTAYIDRGTWLRASSSSPYALQLIVGGRPRAIKLEEGQPFVELKEGETFQLKLQNSSRHDIGAAITLDGVSAFHFSEVRRTDGSKLSRYIVPRGQPLPIAGWHKTLQSVTAFKVTDFSQSAAALVSSEAGLGMITVLIRASWTPQQGPPQDEPIPMTVGSQLGSRGPGIGFGDEQQQSSRIATNRESGVARAIMTVRYTK